VSLWRFLVGNVRLWLFLAGLIFGPAILILPAWGYGRRHHGAVWALLFLALPAMALWVVVSEAHLGVIKSLANLAVEPRALAAGGVVLAYIQVFLLDPRFRAPGRTTFLLTMALASVAVVMNFLVPTLEE